MFTYEVTMVILTIAGLIMGAASKFFWNKIKSYDDLHSEIKKDIRELDDRVSSRLNKVENRATTIESTTVTKEDLFRAITEINEKAERRDEKLYDKLELLANRLDEIRYERSRDRSE